MDKKLKMIIAGIVAAVILITAASIWYFSSKNYVAEVGSNKISKSQFQVYLGLIKYQLGNYGITDFSKQQIQGENAADYAKKAALDEAVNSQIKLMKAKESNITLTSEEIANNVDAQIDGIVKQYKSRTEAQKEIKAQLGVTLDQYKSFLKNEAIVSKYVKLEKDKMNISDDEAKKAYDATPGDNDKVTVRHILFLTVDSKDMKTPLADDKIKEAEKKANDTLAKVKAGGDFAALAKELSEDPGSKENGGIYEITKGQMVKEFEDWAYNAKGGDAGIVKTSYGYHVMNKPKFEELKDAVKNDLKDKRFSETLDTWKKDNKYAVTKNVSVYNSIKVE